MNADPIYDADDSSNSKGRLREIAAIFAAGILRLRGPAGPVAATSDKSFEVIEKPLEESG